MKSFAVTLLTWGALFALLWWGAHQIFYPPGDWIGAALVSFFGALGIGGLRKARIEQRDAGIVQRSTGAPADGKRVAVAGTIEPIEGELIAPLSGQACVIYDYEISHVPDQRRNDGTRPSPVIDKGGMAMAPVFIRSGVREIRLLAYPGIEDFEPSELGSDVVARAREYIAATTFNDSFIGGIRQVSSLLDDRSGRVRADFKNTSHEDLSTSRFHERCVPAHAKVCVVGLYSAKDNAIVPQGNVGGTRLIRGTREDALKSLKAGNLASLIVAGFFLLIPGPIVYGVLTIRENYFNEHGQPSVKRDRLEAEAAARAGR